MATFLIGKTLAREGNEEEENGKFACWSPLINKSLHDLLLGKEGGREKTRNKTAFSSPFSIA
jgi:hypothetical protein